MKYIQLKTLGANLEAINERVKNREIGEDDARREVEAEIATSGIPVDFRAMIAAIVNRVDPQKGIDYAQMKRRFRITDALEAAKGSVLALEDEDHRLLADLAQTHPWGVVDRNIARFVEEITNPKDKAQPTE